MFVGDGPAVAYLRCECGTPRCMRYDGYLCSAVCDGVGLRVAVDAGEVFHVPRISRVGLFAVRACGALAVCGLAALVRAEAAVVTFGCERDDAVCAWAGGPGLGAMLPHAGVGGVGPAVGAPESAVTRVVAERPVTSGAVVVLSADSALISLHRLVDNPLNRYD